jgi:hypothetical protein
MAYRLLAFAIDLARLAFFLAAACACAAVFRVAVGLAARFGMDQ